jgi:hypothetical protein
MPSKINYSTTSLVDNPVSTVSYVPMEVFMKYLKKQTEFDYYCDLLYIDKCDGEFPDLREFKYARRVFITNCKIKVYPYTLPIPNWIESISIEFTEINELPCLPMNLTRLYISRTTLERLPDYLPHSLYEFILEDSPRIDELPPLPTKLSKLICVNTSISELPPLPEELYILYCWNNRLMRFPRIPRSLRYLRCVGNPFSDMPWINLLHEGGPSISQVRIERTSIETVLRFREMYYAVRLRERFKRWLWRPREREAMYDLHPTRIAEFVENAPPEKMESMLDRFYSIYVKQNTRK